MEQLLELFLKNGLKPLLFDGELLELEKEVSSRSELIAIVILKQKGQSTMSELAMDLGAPLSTVTNIGQRLTRRGYIQRERDPKDQRAILVRLTPAGENLADRLLALMNNVLQRVQEVLTADELQQFIALSMKIAKAVQAAEQQHKEERAEVRRIQIDE